MKREKKKKILKQKIIESAKAVFKEYGYEKTTISRISKQAAIGRGTIYNYFQSKADLFISVVLENKEGFNFAIDEVDAHIKAKDKPLEALINILIKSIRTYEDLSKKIWIDIIGVSLSNQSDREYLKDNLTSFSNRIKENFEKVFNIFKKHHLLLPDVDCQEAAKSIHNIAVSETLNYLFFKDITYEDYINNITGSVEFSFASKFVKEKN